MKTPNLQLLRKINKTVLNKITSYVEDDNNTRFGFNGETVIFTLHLREL